MWQYRYPDELYHYGVKGMRWGVIRTPEQLGHRKGDSAVTRRVKNDYNRMSNEQFYAKYRTSKATYAKRVARYGDPYMNAPRARLAKKLNNQNGYQTRATTQQKTPTKPTNTSKNKSKHRLALEAKFRAEGLSAEQAAKKADTRIKTEIVLGTTAAVAVTALIASSLYRRHKLRADGIIKASETMQRVERSSSGKLHDIFYASTNKSDNVKYKGILGKQIKQFNGQAHLMEIGAKNDIKVAGDKTVMKAFKDAYKKYPQIVKDNYETDFLARNPARGKLKKYYENFNINIPTSRHYVDQRLIRNEVFDSLKKQGYGAIRDVHDIKFSGYRAKNPLIVFDKDNVMVKSVRALTDSEISKSSRKATAKLVSNILSKPAAVASVAGTAALYADAYKKPKQKKQSRKG